MVDSVINGGPHRVSLRSAQRRFAQATGISYAKYSTITRARYAALLLRGGLPIVDVAHRAGYFDQPQLTRVFKSLIGQTPSEVARGTATTVVFIQDIPAPVSATMGRMETHAWRLITLIKSVEDSSFGPPPVGTGRG